MQQVVVQPRPRVPTGYRFTPTPEELIRFYLDPWVATGYLFPGVVYPADIYAADPDELTSRFGGCDHDGSWYFLCLARWKGGKAGTRMNRCVPGGGTWHGSSKRKPVGRDGFRQGFEYRGPGNEKTVWIMEEFVTNLPAATGGEGVKVICKVYHSPRAPPAMDVVVVEEEDSNRGKAAAAVGSSASSSKRPMLMMQGGQYGVQGSSSHYIASTSQHQGGLLLMNAPAYDGASTSKRARLPDDAATAYSVPMMAPPAATEYYYAGTSPSQQGAPESSVTWQQQQCTGEQDVGGDGTDDGEVVPSSSAPVDDSADTEEGLAVPPMDYGSFDIAAELGWSTDDQWLQDGEFSFDGVQGGDDEPSPAT